MGIASSAEAARGSMSRDGSGTAHSIREAQIFGPEWLRLPILTLGHLGSHYVWSILNARAALFLMRLGIPKSVTSVVLIAGPLSGLLVQPAVGILSDVCASRWGRRRPYILGGVVLCISALVCLAAASSVARIHGTLTSVLGIVLGILGIVSIDVSINALSAAHRALILDMLHADEQDLANAWATRFSNLGSVMGYLVGDLDLSNGLALDQLSVLTLSAVVLLAVTHVSLFVLLDEPLFPAPDAGRARGVYSAVRELFLHLYHTGQRLPPPVLDLFKIQFFSWLAWFPVLYYSSSWVAEIYRAAHPQDGGLNEAARRTGSFALLCNALVSLAASVVLPWCLYDVMPASARAHRYAPASSTVWAAEGAEDAVEQPAAPKADGRGTLRWVRRLRAPTMPEAWLASQVLFSVSLLFFTCPIQSASSVAGAVALVGVLGLCWALTLWAPYALLGILLNTQRAPVLRTDAGAEALAPVGAADEPAEAEATLRTQAGTVMGLHNWSIVLPQLVTSVVSSLCTCYEANAVFSLPALVWDAPTAASFDSTGLLFRVGSLCTLVAAVRTVRWIRAYDTPAGALLQPPRGAPDPDYVELT